MVKDSEAFVVATALSLYAFNVDPVTRAKALVAHFDGACMDLLELIAAMQSDRVAFAATELPAPTAFVYVEQALARYGDEAEKRVATELYGGPIG